MFVRQLSIFMENKPGAAVGVFHLLEKAGVNIRALSLSDAGSFGLLRMIVDQPDRAKEALSAANYMVSINQVLAVSIGDQPGSLGRVLDLLAEQGCNVEYAYAFIARREDRAMVILRVGEGAEPVLEKLASVGAELLTEADACGRE